MSRTNPVVKIDSLEALAATPDTKVYVAGDSNLWRFTKNNSDPLAMALQKKLIAHRLEAWIDPTFVKQLVGKLKSGSHGFSYYKLTAIFQIDMLAEAENKDDSEKISDILHISKDNGGSLPYALAVNMEKVQLNQAIDQM